MRLASATAALLLIVVSGSAVAAGKAPWENYADRIAGSQEVGRLGDDLLGDNVALNDGSLSFNTVDASLPGNGGPSVQVGRTYRVRDMRYRSTDGVFADWDIQIPSISGKYLDGWVDRLGGQARCSVGGAPSQFASNGVLPWDYWGGLQIDIPGVGGGALLASTGSQPEGTTTVNYPYLTNDHIRVSCLPSIANPASGVSGEGFLAVTPDGTKIWFNWMARHGEPALRRGTKTVYTTMPNGTLIPREYSMPVYRHMLLATRVEDRFGNAVTYTYTNSANNRTKLTQIRSTQSGGVDRVLTLTYNSNGFVSQVADGTGRAWTYTYGTTSEGRKTLTGVTVPGGDAWAINLANFTDAELEYLENPTWGERTCTVELMAQNYADAPVGTLTHPSGATGTFTLGIRTHGRTNVPLNCANVTSGGGGNDPTDDVPYVPASYDSFSLVSKSLTGNGLPAMQWSYTYNSPRRYNKPIGPAGNAHVCTIGSVDQCAARPVCTATSGCGLTASTLVTSPEGRWTRYTYGAEYRKNEGQLLKTEVGYGSGPSTTLVYDRPQNLLREVSSTYLPANADGSCAIQWGNNLDYGIDYSECVVPITETVTWQQGVEFVWKELARNAWAMPTREQRFSKVGTTIRDSRTEATTYLYDVPKWVIGLVTHVRNEDLNYFTARTDFDGTSRLPIKTYWPYPSGGTPVVQQTLAYSTNGVLAWVKDGLGRQTTLGNWHRGVPRLITYPDSRTQSAVVNDRGQITAVTDQNGYTTSYGYDARGLLAGITYPTGDSVAWNGTNLTFAKTTVVEYGFPVGTWKRTVWTGTGYKTTWFDALWRPRLTREHDSADTVGTRRFSAWEYNGAGETVFSAYPRAAASTMASFTTGTYTAYDALGRLVMTRQDWEGTGQLETLTEYLTDFRTKTTNPRGVSTVTSYQAFDDPTSAVPTRIDGAENQRTDILRDVLGRALTMTRTGITAGQPTASRHYVYDYAGRLCKLTEPETGATVMEYDNAGNVVWSAAGLALPTPNPAPSQHGSICATQRTTAYQSGRRVDRTYDTMNRLLTLSFPDSSGSQTWTYKPDGLPASVVASNNGPGELVSTVYEYNRRRMLVSETSAQAGAYSWTVNYGYNPNGHLSTLGYPTGTTVSYAPNALGQPTRAGAMATGVTYHPNGAIKQFTYGNGVLHQMTQNARGLPARSTDAGVIDLQHAYDSNGNVLSTTDHLQSSRSRSMVYDNLDRLTKATSTIFGGTGVHDFTYDVLDNLRSWKRGAGGGDPGKDFASYVYDGSNRLTSILGSNGVAVHTFKWDAQGNLDVQDDGTAQEKDFTFDYGNRSRGMAGKESYVRYDGLGRRVTVYLPDIHRGRYYMYARSGELLFEGSETAQVNFEHVYLGGSVVASMEYLHGGGGTRIRYKHTDGLGSLVATSDQAGSVVDRTNYEPFGKAIGENPEGIGYTGHVMDPQSGMVYMQQRYFDPTIGRFLSVDPVAADTLGGLNFNRYNYGANNPYRFTDPDGRIVQDWHDRQRGSDTVLPTKPNPCPFCLKKKAESKESYPTRKVETITSKPGETEKEFIVRASQRMRSLQKSKGMEFCGEICPSPGGGLQIEVYTSDSHVVCGRGPACGGSSDSIHVHGKQNFRANALDIKYMKSIGINRFDEGDIVPGQSENSFSGQDYKNGPGYLAGKKGIFYQNGEDTSIKYADYPEGWKP